MVMPMVNASVNSIWILVTFDMLSLIASEEEGAATCGFGCCIPDIEPEPLDPKDICRQFEIHKRDSGGNVSESVASDGFLPIFFKEKRLASAYLNVT